MTDSVNISTISVTCIRNQTLLGCFVSSITTFYCSHLFSAIYSFSDRTRLAKEERERERDFVTDDFHEHTNDNIGRNMRDMLASDIESAGKNGTTIIIFLRDAVVRKERSMKKNMTRKMQSEISGEGAR